MKYMLLIHQGDSPTPRDPAAWARLSEEEQKKVYAAYGQINQTPGVTTGHEMAPPEHRGFTGSLRALNDGVAHANQTMGQMASDGQKAQYLMHAGRVGTATVSGVRQTGTDVVRRIAPDEQGVWTADVVDRAFAHEHDAASES